MDHVVRQESANEMEKLSQAKKLIVESHPFAVLVKVEGWMLAT